MRIERHEYEVGSWTHVTRRADSRLAPYMARDMVGFEQERAGFVSWLEPPRAVVTLMIDLEGAIRADQIDLPGAWFGGLSERYTVVELGARYASIDLKLTPLGAYRILGRPVSELEGSVVSLVDVFGPAGRVCSERVREAVGWRERFELVERFLLARLRDGPAPTPAIDRAFTVLQASGGRARIGALAAEVGCSRRYLSERFRAEVGLSPKTAARLIRFESVCRRMRVAPGRWADIAADAGFSDQPHLNREFRDLAGTTPGDFLARCIPGGGVIGD
jgi:AraC-like DNA-binding protein